MKSIKFSKIWIRVLLSLLICVGLVISTGIAQENKKNEPFVVFSTTRVGNVWEGLHRNIFRWYAEDQGWKYNTLAARAEPTLQITHIRRMVDIGADGIVVTAFDADVAAEGVKYAHEHGVPVFTTDGDVNSKYVKMFIGFSGVRAGKILGEKVVEYLKNELEPKGKVEGRVLVNRGSLGNAAADDRAKGFMQVMNQYDGITVETVIGEHKREKAKTTTLAKVRAKDFDVFYGTNGPTTVGIVSALEDVGKNPAERFIVTVDAMPAVLREIEEDNIDYAIDQPMPFYNAIALYYLGKYLQEGPEALPEVGDTITAKDLEIKPAEHAGITWWKTPTWAPAKIKTNFGHLWFQTSGTLVDKSNYDDPTLWANVKLPGW